ncbi:hypothetical protein BB560_000267 [Smittium megazygosporum]|uniref:Uncharacterized protein n=1 Tax=Smittium megazygosporum TaxID=133381 RepID=A0A2T9ZKW8_9FUNG|nr:hypothetical protein BB560_000267 [Smittium megazygosporum]
MPRTEPLSRCATPVKQIRTYIPIPSAPKPKRKTVKMSNLDPYAFRPPVFNIQKKPTGKTQKLAHLPLNNPTEEFGFLTKPSMHTSFEIELNHFFGCSSYSPPPYSNSSKLGGMKAEDSGSFKSISESVLNFAKKLDKQGNVFPRDIFSQQPDGSFDFH